jgi:hypothetical protein
MVQVIQDVPLWFKIFFVMMAASCVGILFLLLQIQLAISRLAEGMILMNKENKNMAKRLDALCDAYMIEEDGTVPCVIRAGESNLDDEQEGRRWKRR